MLPLTASLDELCRRLEQWEILLVVSRIGAVDLYPLPRARHPARLKRHDVIPRKLQVRGGSDGHAQSDATPDATGHADDVPPNVDV